MTRVHRPFVTYFSAFPADKATQKHVVCSLSPGEKAGVRVVGDSPPLTNPRGLVKGNAPITQGKALDGNVFLALQ